MRRNGTSTAARLGVRAIVFAVLGTLLAPVLPVGAVEPGHSAFQRTWARTDQPVASETVDRTWMWGPSAFTGPMTEEMTDATGGGRIVQYFDKSRMEITVDPTVDPDSIWYVTNGLLAKELVTGELQLGLDTFEQREPATINVAGDSTDPNAPTYATFEDLLDVPALEVGEPVVQRVSQSGEVTEEQSLAGYGATAGYFVPETGHSVASPFWTFMNSTGAVRQDGETVEAQIFPNPFYATGLPITEAYWVDVEVAGEPSEVLVQVFERRVLTYTPDNPDGWRVEAGNVGRHYYSWRYGTSPPSGSPALDDTSNQLGATPLPEWPVGHGGQASFVIANRAPGPLTIVLEGPATMTVEVPACPDCDELTESPSNCTAAPTSSVTLQPGAYAVTSQRPGTNTPDLSGVWTFVPDASYGACFFVIDET